MTITEIKGKNVGFDPAQIYLLPSGTLDQNIVVPVTQGPERDAAICAFFKRTEDVALLRARSGEEARHFFDEHAGAQYKIKLMLGYCERFCGLDHEKAGSLKCYSLVSGKLVQCDHPVSDYVSGVERTMAILKSLLELKLTDENKQVGAKETKPVDVHGLQEIL